MSRRDKQPTERRPASQCVCGTWRTPGTTHTKGDTGPTPLPPIGSEWCSK